MKKFILFIVILAFHESKSEFAFGFATDEGPYFSAGFSDPRDNDEPSDDNGPDYFYTYGRYGTPYNKPRYNNLAMYGYDYKAPEDNY